MPRLRCQLRLPLHGALPDRAVLHRPPSRFLFHSSLGFRPTTPHIKTSRAGRGPSFPHPLFATTISSPIANLAPRFSICYLPSFPRYASARNFTIGSQLGCPYRPSGTLLADPDRRRLWPLPLELNRRITDWGGYSGARMAPKQATLGYVKSGQTTLGWVITKEEAFFGDYLPAGAALFLIFFLIVFWRGTGLTWVV